VNCLALDLGWQRVRLELLRPRPGHGVGSVATDNFFCTMFVGNRGDVFSGKHGTHDHDGLVLVVFEGPLIVRVHDSSSIVVIAWKRRHIGVAKMASAADNVIELLDFLGWFRIVSGGDSEHFSFLIISNFFDNCLELNPGWLTIFCEASFEIGSHTSSWWE